jgi:membrane fusion protein, multidrug efflux system
MKKRSFISPLRLLPDKRALRNPLQVQRGLTGVNLLAVLAIAAAAGAGGWWMGQRPAATAMSNDASAPALQAGASAPGAGSSAPGAPGSAGAPGASGAARRFGGINRVQPVTVAAVKRQDVRVILSAIGNISALNTAVVRARVDGELKAIRFKEGQLVRAGALLAEIDPRSYEIALAQTQSELAKNQATLKNAQLDLARYKDLLAKDSIAKQQVDTQESLVNQLAASLRTDQSQVDNARLQLSYTKITAPISGRLGLKQADLGNVIRAGDANGLVTITQTQPISVVFAVPESNLPLIARKLKGTEPLTVEAWDREQRTMLATGKVSTTDNTIDPVTGTIKVKAEFANADGSLFPNQFVNIKLQVNTLEAALAVPSAAVQRGAAGTFVYVVKPDSNVTIRRIRLGATEGDWVSVQGELEAGDRVVTDGADRLREGAKVDVITPPPRIGAGAGAFAGGGGTRAPGAGAGAGAPAAAASAAREGAPRGPGSQPGAATTAPPADAAPSTRSTPSAATAAAPATAPAAATPGAGSSAWIDQLPPDAQARVRSVLERLGPEAAAKVHKMTPDERRAFFQQLRAQRQQQQD